MVDLDIQDNASKKLPNDMALKSSPGTTTYFANKVEIMLKELR